MASGAPPWFADGQTAELAAKMLERDLTDSGQFCSVP